ncbi:MAG: tRNA threonylcarbamoyladenosine biosynthesis protein TsaB, partial [Chlamydiales bacterium]
MLLLILDSSTERGLVAISRDNEIIFERQLPFGHNHSQYIIPTVDEGLNHCGLELKEFDGIAVGIGPGSYTGIRVGAAVAKGLSFASKLPLVGICSLKAFVPKTEGLFASIIDAKMGGAYLLCGEKTSSAVHYLTDPEVYPLIEVKKYLKGCTRLITPSNKRLLVELERLHPLTPWEWEE